LRTLPGPASASVLIARCCTVSHISPQRWTPLQRIPQAANELRADRLHLSRKAVALWARLLFELANRP